ncbi:unnamed protein product [Prunus brigantina]
MANHLRPLFITANFGGVPVPKVMVDGGAAINLLPYRMSSKMGEREKDLIPTRLTQLKIAFFVVDTTSTTYNALLGETGFIESMCSFHSPSAISSWNEEGYMEIVEADPRPFLPSRHVF